jgi:hypothetical protein
MADSQGTLASDTLRKPRFDPWRLNAAVAQQVVAGLFSAASEEDGYYTLLPFTRTELDKLRTLATETSDPVIGDFLQLYDHLRTVKGETDVTAAVQTEWEDAVARTVAMKRHKNPVAALAGSHMMQAIGEAVGHTHVIVREAELGRQ